MKKSQQGFTHFAIVLLILFVAVAGFAGYRVYQNNQEPAIVDEQVGTEQQQSGNEEPEWEDVPLEFDKNGTLSDGKSVKLIAITFTPPKGWEETRDSEFIGYDSPDYKGIQFANGSSVTEGGSIYVSAYEVEYESIIDIVEEEFAGFYYTHEGFTTVGGVEASKGTCGHFGTATCRAVVYEGYYYELVYRQVDKSEQKNSKTPENKYQDEFNTLLESVKFN